MFLGMLAAGDTYETLRERYPFFRNPKIFKPACCMPKTWCKRFRPGLKVEELADSVPEILEQAPLSYVAGSIWF